MLRRKKKKAQNVVDFLKQTKLGDGGDNGKAQLMCMGHKRVEKLSLGFLSSLKRVLKGWYEWWRRTWFYLPILELDTIFKDGWLSVCHETELSCFRGPSKKILRFGFQKVSKTSNRYKLKGFGKWPSSVGIERMVKFAALMAARSCVNLVPLCISHGVFSPIFWCFDIWGLCEPMKEVPLSELVYFWR